MRSAKTIWAAALLMAAHLASASTWGIRMTDFALPGERSRVDIVSECSASGGQYLDNSIVCGIASAAFSIAEIESTDKSLVFTVSGLTALTNSAKGYDRFVTFKESGNNPAAADDVLRVQFDVLASSAGTLPDGTALSMAELTISLISGSLVPDYLSSLLAISSDAGQFVNDVNQQIAFREVMPFFPGDDSGWFTGPDNGFAALLVVPTAVAAPGSVVSLSLAWLAFGTASWALRRGRRLRIASSRLA